MKDRYRQLGILGTAALALFAKSSYAAPEPIPIGYVNFDYVDTSGEPRNQTDVHKQRLQEFVTRISQDLEKTGKYRTVPLTCTPSPCSMDQLTPEDLVAAAKKAGAVLVMYGGFRKSSTLIQFADVDIIDVKANKQVFDRYLTFRGDDEQAWQQAENFLFKDLETQTLVK